jgi:hypothetical protein
MQSIPVSKNQLSRNQVSRNQFSRNQWIAYGTPQWRDAYAARTRELALVLTERRCGQLLWLLQPGFEKQAALACHRELIDEVQRDALRLERVRVLEPETSEADYGPDKTHFNRAYLLQLGPALFHLVDTSGQILHMGCLACHRNIAGIARDSGILPLRAWQGESVLPVWAPERLGMQCRAAFVRVRKVAHRRLAR